MSIQNSLGILYASNLVAQTTQFDTNCFVDKLSSTSKQNFAVGYSAKLLVSNYFGPTVNVRRSSDNATLDFFGDSLGNLSTVFKASSQGTSLVSWLNGSTGFVRMLYDQSGNGRHLLQTTNSLQPTIGPITIKDALTSSGQSALTGLFCCQRASNSYTGPVLQLRNNANTVTTDFYADVLGNLNTSFDGTGTTFNSWYNSNGAGVSVYVTVWYDQSGLGNHASQTLTANQPIYDNTLQLIDFQGLSYLQNVSSIGLPTGVANAAYSVVFKHGNFTLPNTVSLVCATNGQANNAMNGVQLFATTYSNYWFNNDYNINSPSAPSPGNTVVFTYNSTTQTSWINGYLGSTFAHTGYTATAGTQYIGRDARGTAATPSFPGGIQLNYLCIFNTDISDSDRVTVTSYTPNSYQIFYNGLKWIPLYSNTQALEYPPTGTITGNTTTISGNSLTDYNGAYICSVSTVNGANSAFLAFTNGTFDFWESGINYNTGSGNYSGSISTTVSDVNYSGDWVQIQLPIQISLINFSMVGRQDQSLFLYRSPRRFVVAGSNNGTTWTLVHSEGSVIDWDDRDKIFYTNVNKINKFNYFRIITQEIGNSYSGNAFSNVLDIGRIKLNPSFPLPRGFKKYTIVSDFTPYLFNTGGMFIASQGLASTNQCAGIYIASTSSSKPQQLGFVGFNNDAYPTFASTTQQKCLVSCNHTLTTDNVQFTDNNNIYTGTTTGGPSNLLVTINLHIGTNASGIQSFFGCINDVMFFTNTFNTNDSLKYYTPINPQKTIKEYPNSKFKIDFNKTIQNSLPSFTPVVMLSMDTLDQVNLISGQNQLITTARGIQLWNTFTAFNTPAYYPYSGFNNFGQIGSSNSWGNQPYIQLTSGSGQYLNASTSFTVAATNPGFTFVILANWTSLTASWDRIFEFTNAAVNTAGNRIYFNRNNNTTQLNVGISIGGSYVIDIFTASGVLTTGTWDVYTVRFNNTPTNKTLELLKNGISVANSTTTTAFTAQTYTNSYIGKSNYTAESTSNLKIGGFVAYDRFLTDSQVGDVTRYLTSSRVSSIPQVIQDNNNIVEFGNNYSVPNLNGNVSRFNGTTSSYYEIRDIPDIPFSLSFWFCVDSVYSTTLQTICVLGDTSNNYSFNIDWQASGTQIIIYSAMTAQWTQVTIGGLAANVWYHLAFTFLPSFQIQVYLNGSLNTTLTGTQGNMLYRSRFQIGGTFYRGFYGYIKDFCLFDYQLRADQISILAEKWAPSQQKLLTYNTTNKYLVTVNNWYTVMTRTGGAAVSSTDPNVIFFIIASGTVSTRSFSNQTRIQDYNTFKFSFEFIIGGTNNSSADTLYFFMGCTALPGGVNTLVTVNSGFIIAIELFGQNFLKRGIHIINNNKIVVAYYPIEDYIYQGTTSGQVWTNNLTISYNRSTNNTFTVNYNGTDILSHSDPNNEYWRSVSGNFWGVTGVAGGDSVNAWIRRLELVYDVYTSNVSLGDSLVRTGLTTNAVSLSKGRTRGLLDGLTWKLYDGYFSENTSYFLRNKYHTLGKFIDGTNVSTITQGQLLTTSLTFSLEIFGYFLANVSGSHIFYLATDDAGYFWLGQNALIGYTVGNANINIAGIHPVTTVSYTVTLTRGVYYPIRIMYGQNAGGCDIQFSFTPPGGSRIYNGTGYFYTSTGTVATKGILDTLSSTGKNNCTGAFSLVRLNATYIGPVIQFRNNSGTVTTDFYADFLGNLNTSIDQLGTSFSSWYTTNGGGNSVFVTVWYDQSDNRNHARQPTTNLQPSYNSTSNLLDFSTPNANAFLQNTTSIGIPTGTLNAPYSFVVRHGTISGNGALLGSGTNSNNQANSLRGIADASQGYANYWWFNDFVIGTNAQRVTGNTVAVTYNGSLQTGYINGTLINQVNNRTGGTTASGTQYIGSSPVNEPLNGQMYYVFIFKSALSDTDRIVCESTSTLPSVNPLILPAESAIIIKDLTNTNLDGVYYINVNGASTPLYCLMNDIYEGGGWAMLMKGIRGNTFQNTANYWTTQNTLNATDVSRLAGDSKYANFNNNHISDVLAIFPDILSNSATNIYGRNGGSLNLDDGWSWKVNNWNLYPPLLDQLSSAGKTAAGGIYGLVRLNNTYTGPTIQFRMGTVTRDFYANVAGNLGTQYDAGGMSFADWWAANGSGSVFVPTWYDQSGNDKHGTQSTTTIQPAYNGSGGGFLDFGTQANSYLNVPSGTLTTGGTNLPHTLITRQAGIISGTRGVFGAGVGGTNRSERFLLQTNGFYDSGYAADPFYTTTISSGDVITAKFDGTTSTGYKNSTSVGTSTLLSSTNGGQQIGAGQQYIANTPFGEYLNGQLYYVYVFNSALSDNDRKVMENNGTAYQVQTAFASNYIQNKCTALTGFQISRDAGNAGNPYVFSGYSNTLFGTQTGAFGHVFGSGLHRYYGNTNSYIRWGVITNNEGDFATVDHIHGIGLNHNNGGTVYSAGGVGTGINRSMRFEMYGR